MHTEQAACAATEQRQQHTDSEPDADEQEDWKVLCKDFNLQESRLERRITSCTAPRATPREEPPLQVAGRRACTSAATLLPVISGADGETRTRTGFPTTPSRWRVYQFHHIGNFTTSAISPHRQFHHTGNSPHRQFNSPHR